MSFSLLPLFWLPIYDGPHMLWYLQRKKYTKMGASKHNKKGANFLHIFPPFKWPENMTKRGAQENIIWGPP